MSRTKIVLACFIGLALPTVASAQASFFGTLRCQRTNASPPTAPTVDPAQTTMNVTEKCAWTVPLLIDADTALDAQNTFSMQVQGGQSKDTGTHTSRMTNSDQFTLNLTGSSIVASNGAVRSRQGTWNFASGTGALKGIIGSGTYTGIAAADGGMTYDMEGTYQVPSQIPKDPQ